MSSKLTNSGNNRNASNPRYKNGNVTLDPKKTQRPPTRVEAQLRKKLVGRSYSEHVSGAKVEQRIDKFEGKAESGANKSPQNAPVDRNTKKTHALTQKFESINAENAKQAEKAPRQIKRLKNSAHIDQTATALAPALPPTLDDLLKQLAASLPDPSKKIPLKFHDGPLPALADPSEKVKNSEWDEEVIGPKAEFDFWSFMHPTPRADPEGPIFDLNAFNELADKLKNDVSPDILRACGKTIQRKKTRRPE